MLLPAAHVLIVILATAVVTAWFAPVNALKITLKSILVFFDIAALAMLP